ncbi:hypothetical protein A2291_07080 [candidate division WOR-1 bacterium RIFOXYB2_FULL_42_35]|uniref:tetrahydrofolate synthase n=1 Tax=candidate division WOR-1 bacterium RIFOXYC2_FULL_41_25 TaxID=1802586 RepID=A0A1F4TKV8_UNCSA|nr:MAG: hypothetical protein A2247_04420 [candidate division WOR-1 bacterium RIFOXYA2_FULL_41_14]OGC22471.1 MAG: hypothetical protein A2291_07080 [candidate division WOR-1 bacterium RIFOXYB2_FULL_42_35]OGC33209.1 MAG: hypothetical protein A2462_07255 [candidate division WOR-1 bacterium RIFOXYC2_FULL_41_25]
MQPEKYLLSLQKFGIKLGLERISSLLESLENPQLKFKSIHIAGTNGKGSTAAMTASILKEAGYKVGLFTSPHLIEVRERININGKDISRKEFSEGIRRIKKAEEEIGRERRDERGKKAAPTYFEALTAVAFWYFAKKKVDYAVVEVGMGGRFDSTNVITPLVSVITNIDYDHTHYLGKTLGKIAFEKAGIVKPGVPVVTAENKKEPLGVIKKIAQEKNAPAFEVRGWVKGDDAGMDVGIKKLGKYQQLNAACAVAAIRLARIKISRKSIKQGLAKFHWPGRFQILTNHDSRTTSHKIIIDGAHNPAGIRALKVTIKEQGIKGPFVLVVGMQDYKAVAEMVKELSTLKGTVIITRSSHPQAMSVNKLKKKFSRYFDQVIVKEKPQQALKLAGQVKGAKTILVCGSLFLVGDVLLFA